MTVLMPASNRLRRKVATRDVFEGRTFRCAGKSFILSSSGLHRLREIRFVDFSRSLLVLWRRGRSVYSISSRRSYLSVEGHDILLEIWIVGEGLEEAGVRNERRRRSLEVVRHLKTEAIAAHFGWLLWIQRTIQVRSSPGANRIIRALCP